MINHGNIHGNDGKWECLPKKWSAISLRPRQTGRLQWRMRERERERDRENSMIVIQWDINGIYPLANKQLDPENHPFLEETNLPTPMTTRVYVNLLEGTIHNNNYPLVN